MAERTSFDELRMLIGRCRIDHPNWFRLPSDEPASPEQIEMAQDDLGCRLPAPYVSFVSEYGGGDFAFTVVYSVDPDSESSIVEVNQRSWVRRDDFVAFADSGTGDYFGWEVVDGSAVDSVVVLDHTTDEVRACSYVDFVDFVAREGLRQ